MINNFDAQRVFADRDLVKSMVQNLHCISYSGAKDIHDKLADRAGNLSQSPLNVPAAAVANVLKLLPQMPRTPGGGEYRYRVSPDVIQSAWTVLDSSATAAIAKVSAQHEQ